MDTIVSGFTVFFEAPFWVGIFECESAAGYEVCKITFGAEPKDSEVYEFILACWRHMHMRAQKSDKKTVKRAVNPKRMQREVKKLLMRRGAGTKTQRALKKSYELAKAERKQKAYETTEKEKEEKREKKHFKKKKKHRGH
jgi:hypothetical protein